MSNEVQTFRRWPLACFALVVAAAVPAAAVLAQPASGASRGERMLGELQKRFSAADVNGDGKLTREEAKAGMPRVAEHFDEIDAAHAGSITMADIERWAIKQRAARKGAGG